MAARNRLDWARAGLVVGLGLAALGSGCSGFIVVDNAKPCQTSSECGLGKVCDTTQKHCTTSAGACSATVPNGDCDTGLECRGGYCLCVDAESCSCGGGDYSTVWCECQPDEGCDACGFCVPPTPGPTGNDCAPARPDGLCEGNRACCEGGTTCCADGELCVADHCVPNIHYCSQENSSGWCPPNMACSGGRCEPYPGTCACSPTNPTGCCLAGDSCQNGECKPAPCGNGVFGSCPKDSVCDGTSCAQLACSPEHLGGSCPQGQYCSKGGACVANGGCLIDADCSAAEFCSTTQVCKVDGTCATDADCEVQQAAPADPAFGPGYECVASACTKRTTCDHQSRVCIPGEYCSALDNCLTLPACDETSDCTNPAAPKCSAANVCIAASACEVDLDCLPTEYCATDQQCLTLPACADVNADPSRQSADCPPGQACLGAQAPGTCTNFGTPCDSNTLIDVGCSGGALTCCEQGKTCCDTSDPALPSHCSANGNCIKLGECVNDSDCLGGYSTCSGYACVPSKPCAQCTTDEQCTSVSIGGQSFSGCVPTGRCFSDGDCLLGEFCDPSFHCQLRTQSFCGNPMLEVGGAVTPNVLIAVDRSNSMNICGPGDPRASSNSLCGYPDTVSPTAGCGKCVGGSSPGTTCASSGVCGAGGTCATHVCVGGSNAGNPCVIGGSDCPGGSCNEPCPAFHECATTSLGTTCVCDTGNPSVCVGGDNDGKICVVAGDCPNGTCSQGTTPPTTSRWEEAYQAISDVTLTYGSQINFGLSIYPKPNWNICVGGTKAGQACTSGADCPGGTCGDACSISCNWYFCSDTSSRNAGVIEVRASPSVCVGGGSPGRACASANDCATATCVGAPSGTCNSGANSGLGCTADSECPATCSARVCVGGATPDAPCAVNGDCGGGTCPSTRDHILAKLEAAAPGGSTPTAPTLRHIISLADHGGLDATDRANAILLVTDGTAIGDTDTVKACLPTASDGAKDGDETDVDCGGSSPPCLDGDACKTSDDCLNRICRGQVCRPTFCGDGAPDGTETDVDCGGDCGPCGDGKACSLDSGCISGICTSPTGGICATATCSDTKKNGSETDVDCGGACTAKCAVGKGCSVDADCDATTSGVCQGGLCRPKTCGDGLLTTPGESDVDCGGANCAPCADGKACTLPTDCAGGVCDGGLCATPACSNGKLDPLACTGGSTRDGLPCTVAGDCPGGSCSANETDVDCGGPTCGKCAAYHYCSITSDCAGGGAAVCQDFTDTTGGNNARMQAALANAAVGRLYSDPLRIKTFVVGFNMVGGTNPNLNCHAVFGHSARRDQGNCASRSSIPEWPSLVDNRYCGLVCNGGANNGQPCGDNKPYCYSGTCCTTGAGGCTIGLCNSGPETGQPCHVDCPSGTCGTNSTTGACYYDASDGVTLQNAFKDILTQVSACSYDMSSYTIPDTSQVYVYLQDRDPTCQGGTSVGQACSAGCPGGGTCDGVTCQGGSNNGQPCCPGSVCGYTRTRYDRYSTWDLVGKPRRIDFFDPGPACDKLKTGAVKPLVLFGCASGGY